MQETRKIALATLNAKRLKEVKAGCYWLGPCGCACAYREAGGSTKTNNRNANNVGNGGTGLISPQC